MRTPIFEQNGHIRSTLVPWHDDPSVSETWETIWPSLKSSLWNDDWCDHAGGFAEIIKHYPEVYAIRWTFQVFDD